MSERSIGSDLVQVWPSANGGGGLLREFTAHLEARGHRDGTVHAYLESAIHFLRWLAERPSDQREIAADTVRDFLADHLPVCSCPPPAPRSTNTVRAALSQLLLMQGQDRLRAPRLRASEQIEASIKRFDGYMHDVGGLAWQTRWNRCRSVRRFLQALFGSQPLDFARIDAPALIEYVTEQAGHYSPATIGGMACALRSYLRFLRFSGELVTDVGDAIPTPPSWSLAALPPSLREADLKRFWGAFDRFTAIGQRDYAMARCLADMALRCHEVADMRLEAIDWRAGTVQLPQTKHRQGDLLPLPDSAGQALVDYLRRGRPPCTSRAVFVHHRAPMGEGVAKTTVRGAIRRAFMRAGLPWTGTHVLRHTAATRMLEAGTPLKAIADVLRHCSLDTTMIYTKVDLPNLARVALPWPEQQP